jgi:hypothetical protein
LLGGASQTKTAGGNDTATFTVPQITAHDPGESSENVTVSCTGYNTTIPLPQLASPAINTITLPVRQASYKWQCTATDHTSPAEFFAVNFAWVILTVQDEPTVLSNPGPQAVTADASDTKFVSYPTVTPSETPSGEQDTAAACTSPTFVTNLNPSSGTFPVGTTTVTCTAPPPPSLGDGTLIPGRTATTQFKVTVADQPVTLTVPSTQLVQATSSSGATVTYGPVMAAEDGETEAPFQAIAPACSTDKPASTGDGFISGGTFAIGATTVTCTASDPDALGTTAPQTKKFTVIVTNTPCTTLAGCNLHGLDLSGAYLPGTVLGGTDLSNANLAGADLGPAPDGTTTNLSGANLSGANLNGANLNGANLTGATLTGANFNRADLTGANLTDADLTGANLNKAILTGVTWSNTTCPDGTNSDNSGATCVGHL